MCSTDAQELGGGVGVDVAAVERVERMVEESEGDAFSQLIFFMWKWNVKSARRASLFVGLATLGLLKAWRGGRKLSALTGSKRTSLILFPQPVSFCSRPDTKKQFHQAGEIYCCVERSRLSNSPIQRFNPSTM